MNKRIIIRLVLIMVAAVAILGTLMAITTMPNENNNGFVRTWASEEALEPINKIHLEEDLSGIVGNSDHSIFLVGKSPTGLLIVNKETKYKDSLHINISLPPDKLVPFYLKIDSPKLYLHLNNAQLLVDGKFPKSPLRQNELPTGVFMKSVQMNDSIAIIKTPDTTFQYQNLNLYNINSKTYTKYNMLKDSSQKPIELSYDGMLFYDDNTESIIYLEYFRNNIFCLDTNLKLKYVSNTIDTFAGINLKLAKQKANDSTDKLTSSSARMLINEKGTVNRGKLFVVSGLRSDNQNIKEYNSHTNIDVYNIENGEYFKSFMLKNIRGKPAKSILVNDNILFALFENELLTFNLDQIFL